MGELGVFRVTGGVRVPRERRRATGLSDGSRRRSPVTVVGASIATVATVVLGTLGGVVSTAEAAATDCVPQAPFTACVLYDYSGGDQTFTVPAGVTSIDVGLWGAGGGSSYINGFLGAGGGYTHGTVAVTPGQSLGVMVGEGGGGGAATSRPIPGAPPTYGGGGGGGGSSQPAAVGTAGGAAGGGMSALWASAPGGTPLLIAGGGGGGAPYSNNIAHAGGGGGGLSGGNATSAFVGKGGTQTAGGAAGTPLVLSECATAATAGSQYQGGTGGSLSATTANAGAGSGGGGGYFGGGGGACQTGMVDSDGGGGGGSGFIAGPGVSGATTIAGQNGRNNRDSADSGGSTAPFYNAGIGAGGTQPTKVGGNGQVVIQYQAATPSLGLVKTVTGNADEDGSGTVTLGDTLSYRITASNTGDVALTNVVVSDDLTGDSNTCATLAPGADCVLDTSYVVSQADMDAGTIVNTATGDSDLTAPVSEENTVAVDQAPALDVVKDLTGNADEDGSGSVTVGDTLSYTITASNTGNLSLTNVVVSDDLTGDSNTCTTLAVGADCVLDTTYVVTQADLDSGTIVNTATADSDQAGPFDEVNTVPTDRAPDLDVVKDYSGNADEDGSGTVTVGDTLSYTITASNTGNTNLTNVVVSDDLTGQSTTCATVGIGGTCVLTASYTVTQADVDAGTVVNTASAVSAETPTPAEEENTVPVPRTPGMGVKKELSGNADEDGTGTITVGDTLSYTITGSNTGNTTLTGVTLTDDLTGDTTTCATVLVGADCVLPVTYVVTQADVDAGSVVNTATATTDQGGPFEGGITVPVPKTPAMDVVKTLSGNADEDGTGTITVGDTLSYTITGTNTGNTTLTGVVVTDDLTGDTTTCATVAVGADCVLDTTYVVTQSDVDAGGVVNTATATTDQGGPFEEVNTITLPQDPGMDVEKELTGNADQDGSGTITVGDTLSYTITAQNTGTVTLTGVTVTDDLTGNSTACATVAPGGSCVLTATYTVTQADVDAGSVVNTATATTGQGGPFEEVNTVPVPQGSDMDVVKDLTGNADEDGTGTVTLGDTLSYTITASNTGNVTLTGVTVTDDLTGDTTTCATVQVGADCVLDVTYVVTQTDVDAGSVVNTATATTDQGGPFEGGTTVPVPQAPDLDLVKDLTGNADEDGTGTVTLGDTLSYTITASNTGNTTLTDVVVTDDLTGQTTTCATLAPGADCVLAATYTVTQADMDAGAIVNTATATTPEIDNPAEEENTVPTDQAPSMDVVKDLTGNADEDGTGTVTLGDTLSYTITASNTGNTTLTGVTVTDDLTGDTTTCATVQVGADCVLDVTYVVTQTDVDAGSVVNTATATTDQGGPFEEVNTVPVPRGPALDVMKDYDGNADEDGTGTITVGDTLSYTVTAQNAGNTTLTDVVVTDDLTGDTTTCATVAVGGTCVLTASYTVTQADMDAGTVVNTATAVSDQTPAPAEEENTVPIPQNPGMGVVKDLTGNADEDGTGTVTVGDTLSYTITASNTGNVTLTDVVVTDDLTGDTTTCATLAPGAGCVLDATYVVTQADVDAGSIVNTATATTPEIDTPTEGENTTPIPQTPAMNVVKDLTGNADEDGTGTVTVGDTLSYTITASNTGNVTLPNVVVTDDLTGDTTTCATLAVGADCVLDATYVVTQADVDAGSIVNTATATTPEIDTPTEGENTTPTDQNPDLDVVKEYDGNADEDGTGTVTVGDTLSYTITASNTGNTTLTNVTVTDGLTGDTTTCATVGLGGTCVLSATYVVTQADVDAGSVVNTATATTPEIDTPTEGENTVPVPQNPGMSLVKELTGNADEDGTGTVTVGDTLSYRITAANTGDVTLTNVTVADDLTGEETSCAMLKVGDTCVLTTAYVVTQADADAGSVVNTATAGSDQTDTPDTAGKTVKVAPSPAHGGLADTGVEIGPVPMIAGLVTAGAGFLLLLLVWRRRRHTSQETTH